MKIIADVKTFVSELRFSFVIEYRWPTADDDAQQHTTKEPQRAAKTRFDAD